MKTKESEEMYLETILLLSKKKTEIHSIDIADELKYAKSSVSRAVNLLKRNGFILIDRDGSITFTQIGLEKATDIFERHNVLTTALIKLGVSKEVAEQDACRIEHVISKDVFSKLKDFISK